MFELQKKYPFNKEWTIAFLDAMQSDLGTVSCSTIEDTIHYMYGSAEVIGLYMCALLGLPDEAHETAKLQGRAMQYVNFLRDIEEDNSFKRTYIPKDFIQEAGLKSLLENECRAELHKFTRLMNQEIDRYFVWQKQAEAGWKYLPWRLRVSVKTAARLYMKTAEEIRKNPLIVFGRKVKPAKVRIFVELIKSMVF
jgi:15-cis-phytoene synthase